MPNLLASTAGLGAALLLLAGCAERETGPVVVSAIGGEPQAVNPNLEPLDPPSAFLVEAAAQGLVRFNAAGEIEPGLAERWIVSDDGLRYIFRLGRGDWPGGGRITAEQVVARLRAAASGASRNPLKPLLGSIVEIVAMTDEVLEISLVAPRPDLLQLLAQPEMAILRGGVGTGPYHMVSAEGGWVRLEPIREEEEGGEEAAEDATLLLRGEPAALAVARFDRGLADLVTGGTLGDLPLARAAAPAATALVFDPAAGLFGLAFVAGGEGPLSTVEARRALAMAIDRAAIVATFRVPGLQPRLSILPPGGAELPQPAAPAWSAAPLAERRAAAARAMAELGERPTVRIALPDGAGYDLLFAYLRRDWAAIGVETRRVAPDAPAQLRLVDAVAPGSLAAWYLRRFTCDGPFVCDPAADEMIAAARIAPTLATRRALLANADRILAEAAPFIPLAAPVRWSLVSPRLTGFRANRFGRHPAGELIAPTP